MAFDLSNFIVENTAISNENIILSSCIEESYTKSMMNFLMENRTEYNESKKTLYKSIVEATSYVVINESFASFFEVIKKIIDKFINFIKSLFKRFITALHKFVLSDKYLKKNKKEFDKFDSNDEFEFSGYTYTFEPNVPVVKAKNIFVEDFGIDFNTEIFKDKDNKTNSEDKILSAIADKRAKLTSDLEDKFYDEFRAEILNVKGTIAEEDFRDELFKIFRNGDDSTSNMDIKKDDIISCLSFIENYDTIIKKLKTTKKDIEKEYNSIKDSISKMITVNKGGTVDILGGGNSISGANASEKVVTQLDLLIKIKTEQVEKMTNIHGIAFTAKLDAYTAKFKQDKKILYQALSKIQKNHKGGN